MKPNTAVKKRHMKTGIYVAIHPSRIRTIMRWLSSIYRISKALRGLYLTTGCKERKVSGVGCQGKEVLDTDT
jgi:hypothetical protein